MTLIPERFLRLSIRDLERNALDEEKKFWLKRLHEYYAVHYGSIQENVEADLIKTQSALMKKNFDTLVIDLSNMSPEGFTFIGYERGEALRESLHLEQEEWHHNVRIIFPIHTCTISRSFFDGLLGASVKEAGSDAKFFEKYTIECPDHLSEVVRRYVHVILSS